MWLWIHWMVFVLVTGWAIYLFSKVVYHRYCYIRLGQPDPWISNLTDRLQQVWVQVFGQRKLLKDPKSGIMHVVMFYGFIVLQVGAMDLFYKGLFPGQHLPIPFYSGFLLLQEVTTFLVLMATLYAFYRRYIERLDRLKRGWKAGIVIILLILLLCSLFLAATFERLAFSQELSVYTPISSLAAWPWVGIVSVFEAQVLFYVAWWMHALVLLIFLVYIPQSKHFHLLVAPINVFLQRQDSPSKLSMIDFADESRQEYGVGKIENFRQKQLLDLYACVECGRCTDVCPASGTGKMLSPMDLLVKMRDHLTEKGEAITSRTAWMPTFIFPEQEVAAAKEQTLIGDIITEKELWACTTCRNCEDACPVMNEHVDKIIDMRRHLVLTQGKNRSEATRLFQNLERQGNPWGVSKKEREKWLEGAEVSIPTVKQASEYEYLFYVGSMGSYDRRSQQITQAVAKLLHQAGVKFAILGKKEKSSGDTARRLGNEFLFQQLAEETIFLFTKYQVRKIVTIDPHAYNVFKNEYPDLGFQAEIYHHTQVLASLLREGRLRPTKKVSERITYHDSCYLGRYNGHYEEPRYILSQIPGIELVEMKRNRENGLCCGAGGGLMWLEETEGDRVNVARTEQALAVQPDTIGSACPYCLTMLSDGTKAKEVEESVRTMDVAEILARSIEFHDH